MGWALRSSSRWWGRGAAAWQPVENLRGRVAVAYNRCLAVRRLVERYVEPAALILGRPRGGHWVLCLALLVAGCGPGLPAAASPRATQPGQATDAAQPEQDASVAIPKRQGRITDAANVLSPEQEQELDSFYEALERDLRCQIVLLTIESLHEASIEDYSSQVANGWGLRRPGVGDGLLITAAIAEKSVRVEVGDGLKLLISENVAAQIVQDMNTEFVAGRFFKALEQGSLELIHRIRTHADLVGKKQ